MRGKGILFTRNSHLYKMFNRLIKLYFCRQIIGASRDMKLSCNQLSSFIVFTIEYNSENDELYNINQIIN